MFYLRLSREERTKRSEVAESGLSRRFRDWGKGRAPLARICLSLACPPTAGAHRAGLLREKCVCGVAPPRQRRICSREPRPRASGASRSRREAWNSA